MLHADLIALCFIEPSYCRSKFYVVEIGIVHVFCSCDLDLDLDLDPMTFIYELDPYFLEIYGMCRYELSWSRLRKLSSDRQTGRRDRRKLYTCPHLLY